MSLKQVRLLSPQRVFDLEENKGGSYYGDHHGSYLVIQGATICIPYDNQKSLPIGYATIEGTTPKVNLALHNDKNQNLLTGQKLLLHWHHRFGHLNLLAVQRILRGTPFLSAKFSAASKCELHTLKCSTCEYAKGHRRSVQSKSHSKPSNLNGTVGSLKINHLTPGSQVSVDHFESRVLGTEVGKK